MYQGSKVFVLIAPGRIKLFSTLFSNFLVTIRNRELFQIAAKLKNILFSLPFLFEIILKNRTHFRATKIAYAFYAPRGEN